jgi:hypothetical protein
LKEVRLVKFGIADFLIAAYRDPRGLMSDFDSGLNRTLCGRFLCSGSWRVSITIAKIIDPNLRTLCLFHLFSRWQAARWLRAHRDLQRVEVADAVRLGHRLQWHFRREGFSRLMTFANYKNEASKAEAPPREIGINDVATHLIQPQT